MKTLKRIGATIVGQDGLALDGASCGLGHVRVDAPSWARPPVMLAD